MTHTPEPETNEVQTAQAVDLPRPCSAWVALVSKRPDVGQLIAVLQASRHYGKPVFLAGRVRRYEGGMYDYVDSGDGMPTMMNISAYWTPIHELNAPALAQAAPATARALARLKTAMEKDSELARWFVKTVGLVLGE